MQLTTMDFGWLLAMDEGRVLRIEIDYRLGLLFGDKTKTAFLHIETPCNINCEQRETLLMPDDPCSLAPALSLFNLEVADVSIKRTGHLTVRFKDGRLLTVDPNEQYEAWQISYSNESLLVCSPGGGVALFEQHGQPRAMGTVHESRW